MQQYLETILHVTDSEPYAFYRATFSPGESPVLLLHWHPEAEFFYLQEGELLFYLEQKEMQEKIHLLEQQVEELKKGTALKFSLLK